MGSKIGTGLFPVTEKVGQGTSFGQVPSGQYDYALGSVVEGAKGKCYMLVEADLSSGDFDARGKTFKFMDRSLYTVRPCSAVTDDVAGVGVYRDPEVEGAATATASGISSLDDEDYFWIQVAGRAEVIQGDDVTTDPGAVNATNMYATPGDDADTGKVEGTATWDDQCFARFVEVADDSPIAADTDNCVLVVDLDIRGR